MYIYMCIFIYSVLTLIKAGVNKFINQKCPNIQFFGQIRPTNDPGKPPVGGFKIKQLLIMVGRYPI